MTIRSLVDGELTDKISIFDRGLLYGDGVFETIAVNEQRIPLWYEHLQRLRSSCEALNLDYPGDRLLQKEVTQLLGDTAGRMIVRISLTRGVGARGYRPLEGATPSRIISMHPWSGFSNDYKKEGIRLRCCHTKLARSNLAGIKHLNRLEQILAQSEWQADEDYQEGLTLDHENNVIEGTMTNVFIVNNGELLTPDLRYSGVAGVMRRCVIELADSQRIECREKNISLAEIKNADELFVTNSVIGIWPVRQLEEHIWQAPGTMTATLMQELDKKLSAAGFKVRC